VSELTCVEVVELITNYLERALSDEDLTGFLRHMEGCGGCEAYLDQMRTTVRLLSKTPDSRLSPEAELAVVGAFRRWSQERAGQ
jgi:hypothetical protein